MNVPSKIRDKTDKALRKYRAILMLTNNLTYQESKQIDKYLRLISTIPRRDIKKILPEIEKKVSKNSSIYGCKGTLEDLERVINMAIESIEENQQPACLFISKFQLEELFSNYEQSFPVFATLPPHARIGLDILGIRKNKHTAESYLLEAALFEDMAALWNEAYDRHLDLEKSKSIDPIKYKLCSALIRSTAKAAFSLLEGYLNGMAFDILLTQEVSEKDEIKLTEWDKKMNKKRFLTLRDKILQYPKIAVGSVHPVLDEGNFPEFKMLFLIEKVLRNSLVHPNPYFSDESDDEPVNWKDPKILRESPFFYFGAGEICELCDLVVNVIFRINEAIGAKYQKVDRWLFKRDEDGKFPNKAFT